MSEYNDSVQRMALKCKDAIMSKWNCKPRANGSPGMGLIFAPIIQEVVDAVRAEYDSSPAVSVNPGVALCSHCSSPIEEAMCDDCCSQPVECEHHWVESSLVINGETVRKVTYCTKCKDMK